MKRILTSLVIAASLLVGCNKDVEIKVPEGFVTDEILPITPVKDQGKSNLCWAFAMLATIESEHLVNSDSVDLSTDYIGRMVLEEQAHERFDSQGQTDISMRGIGPMLIRIIRRHGIFPRDSYYNHLPVNYNVLQKRVKTLVDQHIARKSSWKKCEQELQRLLDDEIGALPRHVFMLGAEYTPLEFAHSVCRKDEYTAVADNPEDEYGTMTNPHLDDNRYGQKALNMPADSITKRAIRSLKQHHPVFWEGGPNDNHAVCFIGLGHDKDNKKYFIAKNSWGKDNATNGLLYIPVGYVRRHTALVVMHSDMLD